MTPQTLTPAELDELAALEAKATRGPWRPKREPPPVGNVWFDEHTRDGSAPIEGQGGPGALGTAVGVAVNLCDAELIAAMRSKLPALLAMARRLGELQYRWGEFSASNLANLHSLNAQLTAATARVAELDAALTTALADAEMAEHAHDACEELLTAATARADTADALAQAAEKRCGELEAIVGLIEVWVHEYGAALIPARADTYGEGMRDAKSQVQNILALPAKPGGVKP